MPDELSFNISDVRDESSREELKALEAFLNTYWYLVRSTERVGLFGSRMRGDAKPSSDIDILVIMSDFGFDYRAQELFDDYAKGRQRLGLTVLPLREFNRIERNISKPANELVPAAYKYNFTGLLNYEAETRRIEAIKSIVTSGVIWVYQD